MALTFPLSREAFQQALPIAAVQFRLSEPVEVSRLADGTIIPASLGAALWRGTIRLARRQHRTAMAYEAMIALLQRPGASFLLHDPRIVGPLSDPDGVILGAAAPVIHTLDGNARQMRLGGLPVGYILSAGDMLSFSYGSSPTRYALHRLVTGAVADGAGVTPLFEVVPRIRPGAVTSAAVTLIRPYCKALLMPDPEYGGGAGFQTDGAAFGFIQTLR